uniref:Neurotransmitter-gated ion-channel ligand-binding domain-containing protein n=1 Tax=Romanomermis culicivorax TaxID=13658 RepID=A0A915IDL9_ROMCU
MKRVRRKVISDAALIIISINLISWFGLGLAIIQDLELDSTGRSELSRNITRILNDLVHKEKYDKRLRPNYGGPPVEVGITIFVSSISAVSEVEMDFTLDIYLRQMWTDNRLAFTGVSRTHITIDVEYMKSIWVPDTFFPNEKKSFFHTTTTHNSFLRISNTGKITTSQSGILYFLQDYTVDFYLRQMWRDPRLRFSTRVDKLTVGWEYVKDIWVPDTFFPNEKKSDFHTATTHNSFLRISQTGDIFTSHRYRVVAEFPPGSKACSYM